MVKLHLSLLAVTLAIGSALALPTDYQRRSEIDLTTQVESRGFDHEEDLVVRQPPTHPRLGFAVTYLSPRALEHNDDLFERDILDDLEAREPLSVGTLAEAAFKHGHHMRHGAEFAYNAFGGQRRSLEDDEGLFERDLDSEELFERDYDLLDERDILDDLD
jgi:hypothetical protein